LGLAWYDYGARNYNAALGRWMNLDPLAEKYPGFTPYNYVMNNPVVLVDPDGREPNCCDGIKGFLVGTVDNMFGTNYRQTVSVSDVSAFNSGLDAADATSSLIGPMMMADGLNNMAAGSAVLTTSAEITAGSGGFSIEVTVPSAAAGGVLIVKGATEVYVGNVLAANAVSNFGNRRSESTSSANSSSSNKQLSKTKKERVKTSYAMM